MPQPRKETILVSPTAFKGTLTPFDAARIMVRAIKKVRPSARLLIQPIADGGDGTLDVLLNTFSGKKLVTTVTGPMGKPVRARWGIIGQSRAFPGRTAVIEMAEASGLKYVTGKKNIMTATSFGTGELIRAALDRKCRTIILGVGGTASSDGGAGALQALGFRYFDKRGRQLESHPKHLGQLARIDRSGLDRRLKKVRLMVLCDVKNSLLGKRGSARTFGPQKGATPSQVRFLEKFFRRWASFASSQKSKEEGAGSSGGMAFGLSAFAQARLLDGATTIRKFINWPHVSRIADVIITGEGRLDLTSFSGKAVGGIIKNRRQARIFVVCGSTNLSPKTQRHVGITRLREMGPQGLHRPAMALYEATLNLLL